MTEFAIESSHWAGLSKLNEECGEVIQVIGKILCDCVLSHDPESEKVLGQDAEQTKSVDGQ